VSGKSTTDVQYSTFISQGKRVIVHATMSEQSISLPLYDGSISLSPISIKFSVEIHNFGASTWPVTITAKYLAATMKMSCDSAFSIAPSTVGAAQHLGLTFPSSNGLLSGRVRTVLDGSSDDARTSNVFFGYSDPANKTAAESGTTSAVFFRMHVQNANNNMWVDPDLTLSVVSPPVAPTPVAAPQAPSAPAPTAAPVASGQPQSSPTPSSEPAVPPSSGGAPPTGIVIAPFGIIVLPPSALAEEPPTNASVAAPTGEGGGNNNNNNKPGLSGANIALIVFAVVLVVLVVAIIIAVKWPKIKKEIERRRAEQQQRRAAQAMARLNAVQPANAAPAPVPAPAPAPVAPLTFAPPTAGARTNQPTNLDPNLSPRSWAKARKSKLNLVNTDGL
jgi:type II secretory pathway pseudopilin PulG